MENSQKNTTNLPNDAQEDAANLPDGFHVKKFRGREYIIPQFLDLTVEQALAAIDEQDKMNIGIDNVSGFNTAALITNLNCHYPICFLFPNACYLPVAQFLSHMSYTHCHSPNYHTPVGIHDCYMTVAVPLLPYARCGTYCHTRRYRTNIFITECSYVDSHTN